MVHEMAHGLIKRPTEVLLMMMCRYITNEVFLIRCDNVNIFQPPLKSVITLSAN